METSSISATAQGVTETVASNARNPLTERQWERLFFGWIAGVVGDALDNGEGEEHFEEYMPDELRGTDLSDHLAEFGTRMRKIANDLEEQAALRDG